MIQLSPEYSLNSVFDSVQDAILVIDSEGKIHNLNASAISMFGYQQDELLGASVNKLMPLSVAEQHDNYLKESSDNLDKIIIGKSRELNAVHKNGNEFPIEISISRFMSNKLIYYTGTIRDISIQQELDSARKNFLAMISHELRTPLSAIKGIFQILQLQKELLSEQEFTEMLNLGEDNVNCLEKLVNDILDIQQVGTKTSKFQFEQVNIYKLLDKIKSKLQIHTKSKDLRLDVTADHDYFVYADPFRIEQVVSNLVCNACKYDNSENEIVLSLGINGDWVKIQIIDSGPGIDNDFKSRLFTPFSQSSDTLKRCEGGVGLGLYICKQLIEEHCGTLGYEDNPNGGSIFYFELKLCDPDDEHDNKNRFE